MRDGNVLMTRRRALEMLGAIGSGCLVTGILRSSPAAPAPTQVPTGAPCALTPALTEGPFFVDERLERSDLTAGTGDAGVVNGLPLQLLINLNSVEGPGCRPLAGVQVDVWHANASGEYSDEYVGMGQGSTEGQTWLRGYQTSDAVGRVAFRTIYPGSYSGRAVHIHVKARMFDAAGHNATYEFTSQLFFDDTVNDIVMARPPYSLRGSRRTRNAQDFVYGNNSSLLVDLAPMPGSSPGYIATATLGLALIPRPKMSAV
jgi:protocatechuate 3,4-dioxygenase beta subunit